MLNESTPKAVSMDGLSWTLPLHGLWEHYVEGLVRRLDHRADQLARPSHNLDGSWKDFADNARCLVGTPRPSSLLAAFGYLLAGDRLTGTFDARCDSPVTPVVNHSPRRDALAGKAASVSTAQPLRCMALNPTMRTVPLALAVASLLVSASVFAQDAQTAGSTPPARTGFQLTLRSGYMAPFGKATGGPGDDMSNTFSGEVPLLVDLGFKPFANMFLGGYAGLGFGGPSGQIAVLCSTDNLTCVTATFRFGIEAQYQFAPTDRVNPWLGYGIGVESTGFSTSNGSSSLSVAAAGFEFGHFLGGVDFRLSRTVGIGPFVDFSFGQYTSESIKENGVTTTGTIEQTALHEWLLVGARLVFFP